MLRRRHWIFALGLAATLSMPIALAGKAPDADRPADGKDTGGTVVADSLWGKLDKKRWRPLSVTKLFTEGWNEAYEPVPHAVPRQTWIGNADGAFYRLFVLSGSYIGLNQGDASNFSSLLFTPLNRRLEIGWYLPWRVAVPAADGSGQTAGFGDLTVTPRLMLHESERVSVTATTPVRLPTGDVPTGNGVTSVSPQIEFWTNPFSTTVIRGALGATVTTGLGAASLNVLAANPWSGFNSTPGPFDSVDARLAIGQYLTPSTGTFLGDTVVYLASNLHKGIEGERLTYLTVSPRFRTDLWQNWYFLGGVEVPVARPKPFEYSLTFQLIGNF
jgi:hypothetical protein